MSVVIREGELGDLEILLRLNNAAVPNVNTLTDEQMRWFLDNVEFFRVALVEGEVAGLLSALPAGTAYWSQYYGIVSEKFEGFLYIDRIFVDAARRSERIGEKLYQALISYAEEQGYKRLYCEVNLQPPNPGSLKFHKRVGFVEAGTHANEDESKIVQFLCLELPTSVD